MKTYISGKITGLDYQQAKQNFQSAEELLLALNQKPVNPINNGLKPCSTWNQHMIRDIEMLLGCNAILMLSNWRDSKGARIEKKIADELGMLVMFEVNISKSHNFVQRLQNAIQEVTGLRIKDYSRPDRSRLENDVRVIFSHQCKSKISMPYCEIADIVNRDVSAIYRYINKYDDEMKFNPEFKEIAEKVDHIMKEKCTLANSVLQ